MRGGVGRCWMLHTQAQEQFAGWLKHLDRLITQPLSHSFSFFPLSKDLGEGGRKPEPDLLCSPAHGALHLCGYVEERSSTTSRDPLPTLPPNPSWRLGTSTSLLLPFSDENANLGTVMRYEEIGEYTAPLHTAPTPLGQCCMTWEHLHGSSGRYRIISPWCQLLELRNATETALTGLSLVPLTDNSLK